MTVWPVRTGRRGIAAVGNGQVDVLFGVRTQLREAVAHNPDGTDLRVLSRHYVFAALRSRCRETTTIA
jgi:hypothetical protein